MIPYHGTPITDDKCALEALKGGHAFVCFANPQQIRLAAAECQSFAIDNGAFIFWKNEIEPDWEEFYRWLHPWLYHPRLDFFVIPDKIEGAEEENDALIEACRYRQKGVPVWHTNESLARLRRLAETFPRVCIGSSGEYDVGKSKEKYLARVRAAIRSICNAQGQPITKLHLLRGLNPDIFTKLPVSSADSTNVGRNIGIDSRWKGTYQPKSKIVRTRILVDRIEYYNSACRLDMEYDL